MRQSAAVVCSIVLFVATGCKAPPSAKSPEGQASRDPAPVALDQPMESIASPVTELERAEVVKVVDKGLPYFLQDFEVKAAYQEGKFLGFQLIRIHNKERFAGVGLGVGDVVTRVNGRSIEREYEAFDVFLSLKDAPFLEIDYLREGRPMKLSLPIVGAVGGGGTPQKGAEPKPASSPS